MRADVFELLHHLDHILFIKIGFEADKRGGSKSVEFFTLPIILLSKVGKAFFLDRDLPPLFAMYCPP
jgi:hypothetical protein